MTALLSLYALLIGLKTSSYLFPHLSSPDITPPLRICTHRKRILQVSFPRPTHVATQKFQDDDIFTLTTHHFPKELLQLVHSRYQNSYLGSLSRDRGCTVYLNKHRTHRICTVKSLKINNPTSRSVGLSRSHVSIWLVPHPRSQFNSPKK
jgi:hypothetical protein